MKLKYINEYRDRHGRLRRYFRKGGQRGALLGEVGSTEFMAAYQGYLSGAKVETKTVTADHHSLKENAEKTFIYFFRAGEFVKIGQSKCWKARMAEVQTGCSYTVVPLLVLIGDPKLEKKLHNRFRADRFRGEWFHMGPSISAYIKECRQI